ncbi:Atu4866 domain-containing protein [Chitinophaga filiformis]|uniref:Atu4866 domain-containing protein n=1 Tax=Chitinophaga filiformis TaxID=104663 RepID=UPI001F459528|nr:Atu4866 domain-containing protein [Chitinophaga filiformis]MCF6407092.1 Atu4866 domain-containing protein [Chitinophaga filiformis]
MGYFNVLRVEDVMRSERSHSKVGQGRFYKIGLIRGKSLCHYADSSINISGSVLFFFDPQLPYVWKSLSADQTGFLCVFEDTFFTEKMKANIGQLPMFREGGEPVHFLTAEQDDVVSGIFSRMLEELSSDYLYKYDLLRNYVTELIHFALKKKTMENNDKYVGMWVTADGYIRHELLPGGRYDEARGKRKSAYQGSYRLTGDHIDYKDDTGFTADGEFREGILYHAGMVLYREEKRS